MNNNLTQNLKKMAEREKVTFQKIVEVVSNAIEITYKKVNKDDKSKISFNGDSFIVSNDSLTFEIKNWNSDRKFSYECADEIRKILENVRKENEYKYFFPLKDQIISGSLQSINEEGKYCIVNLGNGLGYWDKKQWKKENLARKIYLGSFLRFVISDVKMLEKSTQVIISRSGEEFIKKIFYLEIPEFKNGLISIKKVIRIYGVVSKVILGSESDRNINPVGICIGNNRIRIKSVLKELGKERIDLVVWNENKRKMLINLLSPSEIISVTQKNENEWEVIVPNSKVSLILQASGKILQAIEDYLKVRINVRSFESINEQEEIIIWNGNISFSDFEAGKRINFTKI